MPTYRVRNWQRFQHFKDRRPPWIKLYRELLDNRDISLISDCAFRVLVCCWLLASEDRTSKGVLPSTEDMAFRLRIKESRIIKALQELKGFVYQDDINVISERYQDGPPETETETEKRQRQRERRGEGRGEENKPSLRSSDFKQLIKTIDATDNGDHAERVRAQAAALKAGAM